MTATTLVPSDSVDPAIPDDDGLPTWQVVLALASLAGNVFWVGTVLRRRRDDQEAEKAERAEEREAELVGV